MGLLGSTTAVADVAFERVRQVLTEEHAAILLGLNALPPGVLVTADARRSTLAMQGQFWYRGEYAFAPDGRGTLITYRVINVSGQPDAMIRIWQRASLRRQQRDTDAFAADLPNRVNQAS